MLRDAISSLLGRGSPIFCTEDGREIPSIRDRIQHGEQKLCKRIAAVAKLYIEIKAFVDSIVHCPHNFTYESCNSEETEETTPDVASKELAPGFYLLTLCETINDLLIPYLKEVGAMEMKVIHNPQSVTLIQVVLMAEQYSVLFHSLNYVLQQIKVQNIRGCALLNFLLPHLTSGVEDIEFAFRCLVFKCQVVMVNQLSKWLIYGNLEDVHNEFFIQKVEGSHLNTTAVKEKPFEQLNRKKQKGPDWTANSQYKIDALMLPKYIKPSLANKILYIGRMVRIFGHDPESIMRLGINQQESLFTVWGGKEDEYFMMLQHLQDCEPYILNIFWLENIVDKLRGEVMKHMWQLIKEDAKLVEEIALMKDIYMLGHGQLFRELIEKTENIRLQKFVTSKTARDVQSAFKAAIRKVLPNDETIADKFQFCCELPSGSDEDIFRVKDGWWYYLSIKYTVQWPFQLIFKPMILDNYNIIFRFLLRIKKGLIDLQNVWHAQTKTKRGMGVESQPTFWLLQHKLMYLLNNIQYYLHVSVLEPLYKTLQTNLEKCVDIEEIDKAHMNFQSQVMSQFFLTMRQVPEYKIDDEDQYTEPVLQTNPVHKSILLILQVSEKFCSVAKSFGDDMTESNTTALNIVRDEFETSVAFFMQLLTCVQDHHLFQLCVMLDFNEQFSLRCDTTVESDSKNTQSMLVKRK